jgi:hypothetical protein
MDDPQDQAEALDDDRLNDEFPPERPLGVEEYGVTEAEERFGEPLEERVLREEPDFGEVAAVDLGGEPIVLIDPNPVGELDHDGSAVAEGVESEVGAFDEGDPVAGDPTLRDVATERDAPVPAEEAAIHVIEG